MARTPEDEKIIDRIFVMEGGDKYTNRKADLGGPTRWGVTQGTLAKWRRPTRVTAEDVMNLGEAEARDITYEMYIVQPGFHRITNPDLRHALIDFTYLFGADDSIPALQRIVGARPDGVLGPATAAAANAAEARGVINKLAVERIKLHAQRVVDDAKSRGNFEGTQLENLRGWDNRATAFIT